ncbi:hypothetical protein FACS1894184_05070 [Clostridia bacterium]|nr:hypothetical protein FACS1894184_05070 [Clostridia bacterium]
MEHVTAEVFIPATGMQYDFRLPAEGLVGEIALQMAQALESAEHNIAFDRENLMLCCRDTRDILTNEATVVQCGIMDGHRLMLL